VKRDVEAGKGLDAKEAVPLAQLDRESASTIAGLRQEKVPLSDDPFWDGE
jgi:hypothetical protein